jgi:uncharacterized iron-regulated membrane protein
MRALARFVHRWVGLAVAAILFVSGFTGALLVGARPLDRVLHPQLFTSGLTAQDAWPAQAYDEIARRLTAEFPGSRLIYRLPRRPDSSMQVYVIGDWRGEIFFDARGAERGRRGDGEGFYNWMFELHSSLLSERTGKTVLFACATAYLLLFAAGLVAWWPKRLRSGFALELGRGARRAAFDLHRVGGAVLGLVVLVSVSSGAYMAYRPLSTWIAHLAGSPPQPPPSVAPAPLTPLFQRELRLSSVIATADAALEQGRVSIVDWPPSGGIRVRKQLPDEVHPNGLSSVWLNPSTGAVVRETAWHKADAAVRGFEFIYPLHIGELGGWVHSMLVLIAGVSLALLAGSGPWLWLSRRSARRLKPGPPSLAPASPGPHGSTSPRNFQGRLCRMTSPRTQIPLPRTDDRPVEGSTLPVSGRAPRE